MHIQPASLIWRDGLPYSASFDDIYFSPQDGLAETHYVFLQGNQLAQRFEQLAAQHSFTIAETGFGTGLNFLATWQLWQQTSKQTNTWLHFVSTEKHPLTPQDLQQALALWPTLAPYATQLLAQYPPLVAGWHRLVFAEANITLTLLFGDANELLPQLSAQVDAWFLDGFAPDKNPDFWQLNLLQHMAKLSHTATTLSTFSAAGAVKRALEQVGFRVTKQKGFGRKREMITATLTQATIRRPSWLEIPTPVTDNKQAIIIGAGIAGLSCARALALRGWQVTVIEQASQAMSGASGNPAAIIYPKLAPPALSAWHFQQQAYVYLLNILKHETYKDIWQQTGLLWLLAGNQQREADKIDQHPWPSSLVRKVNTDEASKIAGLQIEHDCLYFPQAGYVQPQALAQHWLTHANINTLYNSQVTQLIKQNNNWLAIDAKQQTIAQAPVVIIANALAAQQLSVSQQLPLTAVRGQIGQFNSSSALSTLKPVLCYGGYLTPAYAQGQHCIGASFIPKNTNTHVTTDDHLHNQQLLAQYLPQLATQLPSIDTWQGRAALRAQANDYLPLVGGLPVYKDFCEDYAALKHGKVMAQAPRYHQGLYVSLGHGSKGFCFAPLAAEVLAAQLNNEPMPIAQSVLNALHPARFWVKQLKRHN
ncbi:MAG: bifunctional tRNA (5-methylaminomethyl-2-thiouridine)(34)-methyltransferase MnmD/FAD-dependent 5-carboxymethylaminomethyl-2-thiouridine(34) oxidoreductase MnmC [Moraxellaceae bacterium]|nr:bifunctional tRNA (5-methylaminomethyl-2-thiouridine)(34)-methyltransferase MnmD/FAD-dependent 5-carboxymethylaminomethyl-2-thiouridine(34) oxidoreductase MnmC [Moraxellaceae bacterium]